MFSPDPVGVGTLGWDHIDGTGGCPRDRGDQHAVSLDMNRRVSGSVFPVEMYWSTEEGTRKIDRCWQDGDGAVDRRRLRPCQSCNDLVGIRTCSEWEVGETLFSSIDEPDHHSVARDLDQVIGLTVTPAEGVSISDGATGDSRHRLRNHDVTANGGAGAIADVDDQAVLIGAGSRAIGGTGGRASQGTDGGAVAQQADEIATGGEIPGDLNLGSAGEAASHVLRCRGDLFSAGSGGRSTLVAQACRQFVTVRTVRLRRIRVTLGGTRQYCQQRAVTSQGQGVVVIGVGPVQFYISRSRYAAEAGRSGDHPSRAAGRCAGTGPNLVDDAVLMSANPGSDIVVRGGAATKGCDHKTITAHLDGRAVCRQGPGE